MSDPRIQRLAALLAHYCVTVQPGDRVALQSSYLGMPLVKETYREVLRAGGYPVVNVQDEELQEILFKEGSDAQLQYVSDPMRIVNETFEGSIRIAAASNTRTLANVDPARQKLMRSAMGPLMGTMMRRAAAGEHRWVTTLFPTQAYAQEADMSLSDYADFVYSACFADKADPVAEWQKLSAIQQRLVDWLVGKSRVRVQGPNVDLTLAIRGRTFINSDGHRNMPSGEIFTGPVEDSVNGWVRFTYPAIYSGREVEGVELRFEAGKVVSATAKKNQAFLQTVLDTDPGASYLGEFAIGTNYGIDRFTKSILFDEKIGGTIHMAVGAGYPETGSVNHSTVHWDMICDMRDGGQIWVDDELFYENGQFLV